MYGENVPVVVSAFRQIPRNIPQTCSIRRFIKSNIHGKLRFCIITLNCANKKADGKDFNSVAYYRLIFVKYWAILLIKAQSERT